MALFQIILRLLTDLIALTALVLQRRRATAAEILVLRRQIALGRRQLVLPPSTKSGKSSRGELTRQHESLWRYSHDSSTGGTLWSWCAPRRCFVGYGFRARLVERVRNNKLFCGFTPAVSVS